MRNYLSLLFFIIVGSANATEKVLTPCPNKNIEVVVWTNENPSMGGTVIFRDKPSGRKIGSFDLGGYSSYAEILWSPDGSYIALETQQMNHGYELFVFRVIADWIKQVKIQDYIQNIYGRHGVLRGGGRWANEPLKWVSNDRLLISARGTLATSGDTGYNYEVEVRIAPFEDDFIGWLEKITPVKQNE
jgi:hypothetical protein